MRTRNSAFLVVLAFLPILVSGCVAPAQPVTTVWQKLGIPQATLAIRDHLSNPLGNNPQLERKPPMVRIVDAGLLDPENPLLVDAAQVKFQEDLAPQKIKALKFLGGIGCCCYELEDAFMAGLSDCTPDVRLAAIEAIESSTTKTDLDRPPRRCQRCEGQREKCFECAVLEKMKKDRQEKVAKRRAKHEALRKCLKCRGSGCHGCVTGAVCCGCNCSSCCTETIQKKLKDMAFGVDESGCFKEPVAEIRNAAAALLAICPPIPEPPVDPDPGPGPEDIVPGAEDVDPIDDQIRQLELLLEAAETEEERERILREIERLRDQQNLQDTRNLIPGDVDSVPILRYSQPDPDGLQSDPYSYSQSLFNAPANVDANSDIATGPAIIQPESSEAMTQPQSLLAEPTPAIPASSTSIDANGNVPPIVTSEPVGDGTLTAEVIAVDRLLSQIDVKFESDYEIPIGSMILVTTEDHTEIEMSVVDSEKARLTARYDLREGQLINPGQITTVGIVSVHQDEFDRQ